jgi:ethanolamine ammonia-lyase small subunit
MAANAKPPTAPASSVVSNPWNSLRRFTPARIGLGRAGISLPTVAQLDFQLAHAQARDAVHRPLDVQVLCDDIEALGLTTVALHSAATSRAMYLQRPDLGRQLDADSRARLDALRAQGSAAHDIGFAVVDGLSALAVQRHAAPLIAAVLATAAASAWTKAPVAIVEQGRVAIGDDIGARLGSRIIVVLIGERPGLSSPDSLGLYLTWAPRPGRNDAERNCISNVRPEGLGYTDAAAKLVYLLEQALSRELTGIGLKDESGAARAALTAQSNFLLGES